MQNLTVVILPSIMFITCALVINWAHLRNKIDLGKWEKIVTIALVITTLASPIIIILIQTDQLAIQQSSANPGEIEMINQAYIPRYSVVLGIIFGLIFVIPVVYITEATRYHFFKKQKMDHENRIEVLLPKNVERPRARSKLYNLLSRGFYSLNKFMHTKYSNWIILVGKARGVRIHINVIYLITIAVCVFIGGLLGYRLRGVSVELIEYAGYPTFAISAVQRDTIVTIAGSNFPPNDSFLVRMNRMHTQGIGGVIVETITTDANGNLANSTYPIPKFLQGESQIAIRFESPQSWFYAYNWFYNNDAP